MKKQISNVRISSVSYFSQIVKENYSKLIRFSTKLESLQKELTKTKDGDKKLELLHKIYFQENEMIRTAFVIITFTVITVESYIYDYAARNLGDAFVKEHLDKLDPLSKWLIIPELITGKELNRNQPWFGLLKKMIATRNKITHYKTRELNAEKIKESQDSHHEILEIARQSISLLNMLTDKIIEIDPDESLWVKHNLS